MAEETQRTKALFEQVQQRGARERGQLLCVALNSAVSGDQVFPSFTYPPPDHRCTRPRDGLPAHLQCSEPSPGVVRYLFVVSRAVLCEVVGARDRAVLIAFPGDNARREEFASIEAAVRALPAFLEAARAECQ